MSVLWALLATAGGAAVVWFALNPMSHTSVPEYVTAQEHLEAEGNVVSSVFVPGGTVTVEYTVETGADGSCLAYQVTNGMSGLSRTWTKVELADGQTITCPLSQK